MHFFFDLQYLRSSFSNTLLSFFAMHCFFYRRKKSYFQRLLKERDIYLWRRVCNETIFTLITKTPNFLYKTDILWYVVKYSFAEIIVSWVPFCNICLLLCSKRVLKSLCKAKCLHVQIAKKSINTPFKSNFHVQREQWIAKEQCCFPVFPCSIHRHGYSLFHFPSNIKEQELCPDCG